MGFFSCRDDAHMYVVVVVPIVLDTVNAIHHTDAASIPNKNNFSI